MKPAAFDYVAPISVEDGLEVLDREGEDARILAGGQSLIAMMNMRLVQPRVVVDISRCAPLDHITVDRTGVSIGAAVTQSQMLSWSELATRLPLLAQALPFVGHYQTRNKGTVCGSVAHADPSSEIPLCLAALGGEVVLRSRRRQRSVRAVDFFAAMLTTAREPDELIEAVRFPTAEPGVGYGFGEFSIRHGDFAIVAVAALARPDGLTVAAGGLTGCPEVRHWPLLDGSGLDDALNSFAWELRGADDLHASARFRRDLLRSLGRATIEKAMSCRH